MNVIRKNNTKVDFATLKSGDVFQGGHSILMAIDEVENKNGGSYNAVDVETGELVFYFADEQVFPLKAELIVS